MMSFITNFGANVGIALTPVLTGLLMWVLARVAKWLKSKTDNAIVWDIIELIEQHAPTVVKELEQVDKQIMKEIQLPHSDGGRKITPAEKKLRKQAAIDQLKLFLGAKYKTGMKALKLSEVEMDKMIGSKVEEALYNINESKE